MKSKNKILFICVLTTLVLFGCANDIKKVKEVEIDDECKYYEICRIDKHGYRCRSIHCD